MTRQASERADPTRTPRERPQHPPAMFPAEPARKALVTLALRRQLSLMDAALEINLDEATARNVFLRRRLRWDHADIVAVALGWHPTELWPDWFGGTQAPPPDLPESSTLFHACTEE